MSYYKVQRSNNTLEHHGILGMHWGIRRFQPYSTVPRKSGEKGKEVGEAKKAAQNDDGKTGNRSKTQNEEGNNKVTKDTYGNIHMKVGNINFMAHPDGATNSDDYDWSTDADTFTEKYLRSFANDYLKNKKAVDKACRDSIDNDRVYDLYKEYYDNGLSKKEFLDSWDIRTVYAYGGNDVEITMAGKKGSESILGGHSLTFEMNLKNPKPDKRGVAING